MKNQIYFFKASLLIFLVTLQSSYAIDFELGHDLKLNTSNLGKLVEFQRLFGETYSLTTTKQDLGEIESTPENVAIHKSIQMGDDVLVEDTSLDVEGASVGVNVKWMLDNLHEFEGKAAKWTVMLAIKKGPNARICHGVVSGTIVKAVGNQGFGFDPVFKPDLSDKTLAQEKPDRVNARFYAVQALMSNDPKFCKTLEIPAELFHWSGAWQH